MNMFQSKVEHSGQGTGCSPEELFLIMEMVRVGEST